MMSELLSKACAKILERQKAGKDLTETQDDFCSDINYALEDWWRALHDADKRKLRKWFVEPYLSEMVAAIQTLQKGWDALDKIAQHL